VASAAVVHAARACSIWLREGPGTKGAEQVEGQGVQVLVILQPIGRIQQVDPPGHGAKQPRVGRGHAVDHQPQEEGQAARWIGDVDRLPAPPAGPVAVLGGDRPLALADVLAQRRVKTPGQIMVVGGDRQQVGQGEPVV
jgi:hypothetical protein